MAGYAMSFVKYLICGFNLLFFTMGLILIILGSIALGEIRQFDLVRDEVSVFVPSVVMATGTLIILVAFVGCISTVQDNYWLTVTYSLVLFVILIMEIVSSVSAYVFIDTVGKVVEDKVNSSFSMAAQRNDDSAKKSWDRMQKNLKCCGVHNFLDWTPVPPPSCCESSADQLPTESAECPQTHQFREGCLDKLQAIFIKQGLLMAVLLVVFLFLQVMGIVCACCLANVLNKEHDVI